MNITPQVPSPSPSGQVNEIERQSFGCMLAARKICVENTFRFESDLATRQINYGSNDGTTESGRTVTSNPSQSVGKKDVEGELLICRTRDSENTEELTVSKGAVGSPDDMNNLPEIAQAEEQILHKNKRICVREALGYIQFRPNLFSPNGIRSDEPSEKGQEDDLDRGIAAFEYCLERVKDKLVSSTRKKCAEILASTAE